MRDHQTSDLGNVIERVICGKCLIEQTYIHLRDKTTFKCVKCGANYFAHIITYKIGQQIRVIDNGKVGNQ